MNVRIARDSWKYARTFRISGKEFTHSETVVVQLEKDGATGRGEALGVFYRGEDAAAVFETLSRVKDELRGVTRESVLALLPPGGARNAVDCALWDLEAKLTGVPAWKAAGLDPLRPLKTTLTLGVDVPEAMAAGALAAKNTKFLKIKTNGDGRDLARLTAIRSARPEAILMVDANQGWSLQQLREYTPRLVELDVKLIEQPLPAGEDSDLDGYRSPIPLCADESCQTVDSLPAVVGRYAFINIKLDKTGGLTEALRLARAAQAASLKLMVGCMGGTSLSMAPAFLLGQRCELVDLDGPLLLLGDMEHGLQYSGSSVSPPSPDLWG